MKTIVAWMNIFRTFSLVFSVSLTIAVMLSATVVADEQGFVSLLTPQPGASWLENGKPLNGWVKRGGDATFTVEGDSIVGKRGPGINTFLCTEKKYSNFILTFEVKYDIECNSGVQFRSDVQSQNGQERLVGYQCEIVTEGDTANIYDEHRRNRFLVPQTPELRTKINQAFKKDNWNEIVIQCVGPSIKTWLNGEKIADFTDIETNEGIFGLQVHSGEQGQVRWRNIQIRELRPTPWILLYADKKFGEVETKPVGKWEIQEDGSLRGTTEEGQPKDGMLLSKESYKNFAAKVAFKMITGNSGLYFRAEEVDKPYWLKGFQCEIAVGGDTAGLWEVQGRGWVAKNVELAKEKYRTADWNEVGTVAVDDHLTTFLNGWTIVDIDDPKCAKEGKTGLQLHGGGNQGCLFRDYYIMPLDEHAVELIKK
ncbi:MAG: DUF1080 domain-containing protein [Planctomycetaceae bacterium]|jgi:hypothetical protein|nr:DUF1080 domain-containing protein [Planctomycetaceae bacterium]